MTKEEEIDAGVLKGISLSIEIDNLEKLRRQKTNCLDEIQTVKHRIKLIINDEDRSH